MAGRDDFNSSMNSPGGWGGTGGSSMGGMGGQKASTYNYYGMPGSNAQANYNTGGALTGSGNQFGVSRDNGMMRLGPIGAPQAPIQMQPIPPIPQPVSYPPVTQEDIPGVRPQPMSTPPGAFGHPGGPGYAGSQQNFNQTAQVGTAPQGIGGRPPGASFGYGNSNYGKMGGDFRNISNW